MQVKRKMKRLKSPRANATLKFFTCKPTMIEMAITTGLLEIRSIQYTHSFSSSTYAILWLNNKAKENIAPKANKVIKLKFFLMDSLTL